MKKKIIFGSIIIIAIILVTTGIIMSNNSNNTTPSDNVNDNNNNNDNVVEEDPSDNTEHELITTIEDAEILATYECSKLNNQSDTQTVYGVETIYVTKYNVALISVPTIKIVLKNIDDYNNYPTTDPNAGDLVKNDSEHSVSFSNGPDKSLIKDNDNNIVNISYKEYETTLTSSGYTCKQLNNL